MIVEIINKLLMIVLILSSLNVFRHTFYFTQAWLTSTTDEAKKYIISNQSLVFLGLSISYVISSMILGIGIGA